MAGRLHILRAGTWTDMHGRQVTLTPEDLAATAAAYDPARHRAPIVVGHPQHNSPAWGWLAALHADGEDLEADPEQVDPDFAEAVRAGRYATVSASLYPPEHPANPVPGVWYPRHLGFLGGMPPAVKGLRGADLADGDADLITLELAAPAGTPDAPPEPPMPETQTPTETPPADPAVLDLAERESALAARAAELDAAAAALAARESAVADAERAARRAAVISFAEQLADEARIRPADVPRVTAVLLDLDAYATAPAADFAEEDGGEPQTAGAWLRGWLAQRPPLVELGETATPDRLRTDPAAGKSDAQIAAEARDYRARQLAAGHHLSLAEAVDAVTAGTATPER